MRRCLWVIVEMTHPRGSRGFTILVFTFWKIPSSDAIPNPLILGPSLSLIVSSFLSHSSPHDPPLSTCRLHSAYTRILCVSTYIVICIPATRHGLRMNMDMDVDAQRAASHTEISTRSSSEFRVVNVRRIIRTQVRRSCVWRRTDASRGSVEAAAFRV